MRGLEPPVARGAICPVHPTIVTTLPDLQGWGSFSLTYVKLKLSS